MKFSRKTYGSATRIAGADPDRTFAGDSSREVTVEGVTSYGRVVLGYTSYPGSQRVSLDLTPSDARRVVEVAAAAYKLEISETVRVRDALTGSPYRVRAAEGVLRITGPRSGDVEWVFPHSALYGVASALVDAADAVEAAAEAKRRKLFVDPAVVEMFGYLVD